jgi:chemotaxis protein MotB
MKKRVKKHEHVNHERWLVSYADFITLLFAFFVVMFSVSQVDSKKLGRFVESVNTAFQFPGVFPETQGSPLQRGGSAGTSIVPLVVAQRPSVFAHQGPTRQVKAIAATLQERFDAAGLTSVVSLRFDPRGLAVSLPERAYFFAGTARLRPEAVEGLRAIAQALAGETAPIQVEAHTDDLEAPSSSFASNWELTAARAARVAAFLAAESRIDPARLSASGLAQYHPLVDDSGFAASETNRRVDLVLIVASATDEPTEAGP